MTPRLMTSAGLPRAASRRSSSRAIVAESPRSHSLGHTIAHQQDAPAPARGLDGEIGPAEAIEIERMNLRETIGLALNQQPIVDEPSLDQVLEMLVALGHHLVRDSIETVNLGKGKLPAEEHLLANHDKGQGEQPEQPEMPRTTAGEDTHGREPSAPPRQSWLADASRSSRCVIPSVAKCQFPRERVCLILHIRGRHASPHVRVAGPQRP